VGNLAGVLIKDYMNRWSSYVDIKGGGNRGAATGIVVGMLQSTESLEPANATDGPRLWPLGEWLEGQLEEMGKAFAEMSR
jgi:hypothetical protein